MAFRGKKLVFLYERQILAAKPLFLSRRQVFESRYVGHLHSFCPDKPPDKAALYRDLPVCLPGHGLFEQSRVLRRFEHKEPIQLERTPYSGQ